MMLFEKARQIGFSGIGVSQISLTAAESGSEYQITSVPAATASWTEGNYALHLFVVNETKSQRLNHGKFEGRPNRTSSNTDPRSDAQENLKLIECVLYGRNQSPS